MSGKYWLLRVPERLAVDSVWSWRNASDATSAVVHGSLADFVAAQAESVRLPVVALLPVAQVLAVPVLVPQRQQRQLLSALPYLLEETLAADIERFHVIAGMRIDNTRMQAVAIERDWLRAVLSAMQEAGIDPDIVTADALALPDAGTLFLDGERSLLRAHDGSALSFDEQDAVLVASALSIPAGRKLLVLAGPAGNGSVARAVEAVFSTMDLPPDVLVDETACDLLDVVARLPAAAFASLPNLRQGTFAKIGSNEFSLGFDWRPLAWLAACWAVVALGYQLAVGISYSRAVESAQAAQVELYKQVYPGSANVPRPRQQMEGQLGSSANSDGVFVSLVARTAGTFAELGGTAAGYSPRTLAWDNTQKQLRIDVLARSLEDLDKLRAALQQKGLSVDIGAGIAQDGGYKARMNVGEGA